MRNKLLLVTAVVSFLLVSIAGYATPGPLVFRVATAKGQNSLHAEGLYRFKELVERRAAGRIRVEVYTSGVRGQEKELLDGLLRGTVDAVLVASFKYAALVPEMDFLSLPLLFATEEHWREALTGRTGQQMAEFALQRRRDIVMGYMTGGARHIFTRREVISLGGLQGAAIGTGSLPLELETWRVLGLKPKVVADSEFATALQSGWVEVVESNFVDYNQRKLYEQARCILQTEHKIPTYPFVLSGLVFERIPEELRAVVLAAGKEASLWQTTRAFAKNKELEEEMVRKFWLKPLPLSLEEKEAWERQTAPLQNRVAAELGVENVLKEIRACKPVREDVRVRERGR